MKALRPYVLSIAGHDPSGGAGILADIKTFEANKAFGLGVASAITFQNENTFKGVNWIDIADIKNQADLLISAYKIEYVKIGLVSSIEVLKAMIDHLKNKIPGVKIIWDPIMKATAGFEFHQVLGEKQVENILKEIFLITPNHDEAADLTGLRLEEALHFMSRYTHVYYKGGHHPEKPALDVLLTKEGKQFSFRPRTLSPYSKHGSGCVFSAALTAHLAKGFPLHKACLKSKSYTEQFIHSNPTRLGYHKV